MVRFLSFLARVYMDFWFWNKLLSVFTLFNISDIQEVNIFTHMLVNSPSFTSYFLAMPFSWIYNKTSNHFKWTSSIGLSHLIHLYGVIEIESWEDPLAFCTSQSSLSPWSASESFSRLLSRRWIRQPYDQVLYYGILGAISLYVTADVSKEVREMKRKVLGSQCWSLWYPQL